MIGTCPVIQLLMLFTTAGIYPPKLKPAVCPSNVCYQDSLFTTLHCQRCLSRIFSLLKSSKNMYTNTKAQEVSTRGSMYASQQHYPKPTEVPQSLESAVVLPGFLLLSQ